MDDAVKESLTACRESARARSLEHMCSQHVNATLAKHNDGLPYIAGFTVSDWCDGSTVETWYKGSELS